MDKNKFKKERDFKIIKNNDFDNDNDNDINSDYEFENEHENRIKKRRERENKKRNQNKPYPVNSTELKKAIGPDIYKRSKNILYSGKIIKFQHLNDCLYAHVEGSHAESYLVNIKLNQSWKNSYCECPCNFLCKHIGAVMLHYYEMNENALDTNAEIPKFQDTEIKYLNLNYRDTNMLYKNLELSTASDIRLKKSKQRYKLIFLIDTKKT